MAEREERLLLEAVENIASELEKLRLLEEYKLGVHVHTYPSGDLWVEERRSTSPPSDVR